MVSERRGSPVVPALALEGQTRPIAFVVRVLANRNLFGGTIMNLNESPIIKFDHRSAVELMHEEHICRVCKKGVGLENQFYAFVQPDIWTVELDPDGEHDVFIICLGCADTTGMADACNNIRKQRE